MKKTFAHRYSDIRERPRDIKTLLNKFPFLQEPEHVRMIIMCVCVFT